MSIWVIIDTFKSDDVIRKRENSILALVSYPPPPIQNRVIAVC